MKRIVLAAALVAGAAAWVAVLSLGAVASRQPASVPASDGSKTAIKLVDKSRFSLNRAGEVGLRLELVDANGKTIEGILQKKFRVLEEGIECPLVQFNGPGTQPLNVFLVIDHSGSMGQHNKMEEARLAALTALDLLKVDRDRLGIIAFDDNLDVLQPLGEFTSANKSEIERRVRAISVAGGTRIGEPTIKALEQFRAAALEGPKILMVMTDGEDPEFPKFLERIEKLSDAASTLVYTIAFGDENPLAKQALQAAAARGKGQYHHAPTGKELADIYRDQVRDAASEYYLAYHSPYPEPDGIDRRVQLFVDAPSGQLAANSTYKVGSVLATGQRGAPKIANTGSLDSSKTGASSGGSGTRLLLFMVLLAILVGALLAPTRGIPWPGNGASSSPAADGSATAGNLPATSVVKTVAGAAGSAPTPSPTSGSTSGVPRKPPPPPPPPPPIRSGGAPSGSLSVGASVAGSPTSTAATSASPASRGMSMPSATKPLDVVASPKPVPPSATTDETPTGALVHTPTPSPTRPVTAPPPPPKTSSPPAPGAAPGTAQSAGSGSSAPQPPAPPPPPGGKVIRPLAPPPPKSGN